MKKQITLAALAITALLPLTNARASVIAIVDSGTDINHPEIVDKIWANPGEIDDAIDNDDNGYIDDLFGWNFVDNNNHLVNKNLIGTFSPDTYKYFDLQTKYLRGTATADEVKWLKSHVADKTFVAQLEAFGNHVHGTHVAGISARNANEARIMTLRLISGDNPPVSQIFNGAVAEASKKPHIESGESWKEKLVYLGLDALALAQGTALSAESAYINMEHAVVANCSFGTSQAEIEPTIKPLIETILGVKLTPDQLHVYSSYFLNKAVAAMEKSFTSPAGNTLFVIAAGNDGTNNDTVPAAPANIKSDNTITVAATLDRASLAVFSNYGETTVDIAAPGVGIRSTVPGGQYLELSGTSQATPYITNIAGQLLDANPKLSPLEVKKILMATVDKKDFLAKKVNSGGVANGDRAVYAAKLSATMALGDAITHALHEVGDLPNPPASVSVMNVQDKSLSVVRPLPYFMH